MQRRHSRRWSMVPIGGWRCAQRKRVIVVELSHRGETVGRFSEPRHPRPRRRPGFVSELGTVVMQPLGSRKESLSPLGERRGG